MRVRFAFAALCGIAILILGAVQSAAAWDTVLSGVGREAPECVSWSAGRLDCFARRSAGHLTWITYDKSKWSAPQDLGGDLPGGVSCVVRGPGGINCFAPTGKGVLAEIHLNGTTWSAWSSLGGELAIGRASCVSPGRDRIACYARGRQGHLMSRAWNGGEAWEAWRDLGGALGADPFCVVLAAARVACFGKAPSGEFVAYLPNDSAGVPAWVTYGGHVQGRPSCGAVGGNDVACAVRGEDDRLYVLRGTAIAGKASGKLVATGDAATDDPACAPIDGEFTCFARNAHRQLSRRSIRADGNMSDGRKLNDAPESTGVACLSIQEGALACLISDTERRLQFAMGGDLNGDRIADDSAPGVDESPTGRWYLSNLETNEFCQVRLSSDAAYGANRLEVDPDCRDLPGLARAAQWHAEQDRLEFLTPRGDVVARFHLTGSGRWISPGRRSPYLLSRERPEGAANEPPDEAPPPTLRFDEGDSRGLTGPWRLTATDSGRSCDVRLTDWPAGNGNAVVLRGPCAKEIRAVQFWSLDKNALVLSSGDGQIVARFSRQSPASWQGESTRGAATYNLTR